ncbi:hypothetical protein [Clostridium sp.]|uniref:hypothetical protein n=1 Tax=Clostridium sp. TaxID=1506 RepID=UPI00261A6EA9|nr:hypothetical protein [Clostridium sp.]
MFKNKKRYLIFIFSIFCVLSIYYIYNTKHNVKAEDITHNISLINIFSGNTGKEINVDNKDDINRIIMNLNNIEFQKDKSSKDFDGYAFAISFYDLKGTKKDSVIINSINTIIYNDYFYKDRNSSIDYDFINGLFNKYIE